MNRPLLAIFCAFALLPITLRAEDDFVSKWLMYNQWYSPEKLYLHIDRTYYAVGETIWFKAYLTNASPLCEKQLSRYMYVEMLNKDGICVQREKLKVSDVEIGNVNCFTGQMLVDSGNPTGEYTIRAYTDYQLNRDPEYLFNQKIRIRGEDGFAPASPDSGSLNVSFYPEGGVCLADHAATIAFKALDSSGHSMEISGKVIDEGGNVVCGNVQSSHDGMGSFSFTPAMGAQYTLLLDGGERFKLPEPALQGASLQLVNTSNAIYVSSVLRNMDSQYLLYLRDNCSMYLLDVLDPKTEAPGQLVFDKKKVVSTKYLRSGLNHVILADKNGHIVSERLFYIFPGKDAVRGKLDFEKSNYGRRARIRSLFSLKDAAGKPLDGNFSISVVRGAFRGFSQSDDIVSYMEIASELKGKVNDPAYYFCDSLPLAQRRKDIDLLMMVQGWRYYDLDRILAMDPSSDSRQLNEYFNLKNRRELSQSISGTVAGAFGGKRTRNYNLSIFIPSQNAVRSVFVDKGNSFYVDSLDFKKNTAIVVSAVRDNEVASYKPVWDGDKFASPYKYDGGGAFLDFRKRDDDGNVPASTADPGLVNDIVSDFMVDSIAATTVTAYKMNLASLEEAVGVKNRIGSLEAFYEDRPVLDYILAAVPCFGYDYNDHVLFNRTSPIVSFMSDQGSRTVDVEINGTRSEMFTEELEHLMTSDVKIEYISTTGDALNLRAGGIVSLNLDWAKLKSRKKDPTTIHFVPLGYQEPDKFYSPYYAEELSGAGSDFRNTVYWSPDVIVKDGFARVNFSNIDLLDYPYTIHVEGVTSDGRPFSWHGVLK